MNKIVSTKTASAIFLAIVLVAGTIAAISPSFIVGTAQAQSSYGYNSYDKPYGKDRDKSKDSSVNINKKCINTNLNINGNNAGNVSIGNKGGIAEGYLGANSAGSGDGYSGGGYDNNKKDKDFTCIINNNNNNTNIVTVGGGNQTVPPPEPEPTTANLIVTKTTNCNVEPVICGPINPQIIVTGVNATPSSFLASQTPVDVTLDAGQYSVSEAGFISGLQQCFNFQGGQLISGQVFYMCTNFSADCSGDISAGQELSCTIENTVINVD